MGIKKCRNVCFGGISISVYSTFASHVRLSSKLRNNIEVYYDGDCEGGDIRICEIKGHEAEYKEALNEFWSLYKKFDLDD